MLYLSPRYNVTGRDRRQPCHATQHFWLFQRARQAVPLGAARPVAAAHARRLVPGPPLRCRGDAPIVKPSQNPLDPDCQCQVLPARGSSATFRPREWCQLQAWKDPLPLQPNPCLHAGGMWRLSMHTRHVWSTAAALPCGSESWISTLVPPSTCLETLSGRSQCHAEETCQYRRALP